MMMVSSILLALYQTNGLLDKIANQTITMKKNIAFLLSFAFDFRLMIKYKEKKKIKDYCL